MLKLFVLTILLVAVYSHKDHKCIHDSLQMKEHYRNMAETFDELEKTNNRRILQQNGPAEQMRITIDYSPINSVNQGISSNQKQYLTQIMEAAKIYFQRLLKVNPISGNNKWPKGWRPQCMEINVSSQDKDVGVPNSDLHLYVNYVNQPNSSMLANAGFCSVSDSGIPRPVFGRVQFNIGRIQGAQGNHSQFEDDLETTVHEILHVLGFSGGAMDYWINPNTGKPYGKNGSSQITKSINLRGRPTTVLFSKNVQEATRKYFGCPNAEGMQIENEGGQGSLGSHWEKVVIYNEMMTASAVAGDAVLSIFTIALLKDTGFYAEVNENMADKIFWGKGKGCDFLTNACQSRSTFPEFPKTTENQCSFEFDGIGQVGPDTFSDGCNIVNSYSNRICTDPSNNNPGNENAARQQKEMLYDFGTQSKCFKSDVQITDTRYIYSGNGNARCHKFKCNFDVNGNASSVDVIFTSANFTLNCDLSKQGKSLKLESLSTKVKGDFTCPDDYERFCNYTPICPNFCSSRGVCVQGTCICQNGFGGEDCSQSCQAVEDGKCVPSCSRGKFLNSDNTCRSTCSRGYFPGRNGKCELCHANCATCTGPSQNECTACQFMTYLQSNSCVQSCDAQRGFTTNEKSKTCQEQASTVCNGNCSKCAQSNKNQCYACKPGTFFSNNQCLSSCPTGYFGNVQNQSCQLLSPGCLGQTDSNSCQKCDESNGFRLAADRTCTRCKAGCADCHPSNPSVCQQCEGSLLLIERSDIQVDCVPSCPSPYTQDNNRRKCVGCPDNTWYIDPNNQQCARCSTVMDNCDTCQISGLRITCFSKPRPRSGRLQIDEDWEKDQEQEQETIYDIDGEPAVKQGCQPGCYFCRSGNQSQCLLPRNFNNKLRRI